MYKQKRKYFVGSIEDRLMAHSHEAANGCRLWNLPNANGYGVVWIGDKKKQDYAHRVSYQIAKGTIPDDLELDHVCHDPDECSGGKSCIHRACINPNHLKPVTHTENSGLRSSSVNRYKTHCPQGHPYEGDNLICRKGVGYGFGYRYCKECSRDWRFFRRTWKSLIGKNLWPKKWRADAGYRYFPSRRTTVI